MAPILYFPRFIYIKKIKIKAAYGVRMGGGGVEGGVCLVGGRIRVMFEKGLD
jgi:hypothetical protein